jgi:Uma2 family endonuclease
MTPRAKLRMTADEFIAWATGQPQRYELIAGDIVAMSPERAGHTRLKHRVWLSLRNALRQRGLACEALGDGASVRVDDETVYEPDTLVRCGEPVSDDSIEIADPVIVVEVVSPSSRSLDAGAKLDDYFRLASVRHYLIVNGKNRTVIHHGRAEDGRIETSVIRSGALALDPPGIAVETFFEDRG